MQRLNSGFLHDACTLLDQRDPGRSAVVKWHAASLVKPRMSRSPPFFRPGLALGAMRHLTRIESLLRASWQSMILSDWLSPRPSPVGCRSALILRTPRISIVLACTTAPCLATIPFAPRGDREWNDSSFGVRVKKTVGRDGRDRRRPRTLGVATTNINITDGKVV
jgi:hypothetical protein